ncbi:uncharacterized protein LOC126696445 [Quercus robur]|uniref:uncharacterized protein LOC126696445 n=1 Tax=Quercus robur TaxID=38942 RepID=UPI0021616181|nr:uncharacterized protein LOC126696445 [Quercus robur]
MVAQWEHCRVEKLIMVGWAIWTNRNESRHGGVKKNNRALLQWSLDYLWEYQACSDIPVTPKTSGASSWIPPTSNRYKINVDGAVFASQKMASVGVLIRDAEGRLIGSCCKKIMAPLGAIKAEAKAIEVGLQLAKDLSIQDFTLKGDSQILINALKDTSPPPASVVALVYSSVATSYGFHHVNFSHICR